MKIININGPINSGKTTISEMLAKKLPKSVFIEVDNLLSDEEQDRLGLCMEEGWGERTDRLAKLIGEYKKKQNFDVVIFAYPITQKLYAEWKSWEDDKDKFINITLSPDINICLQNRGKRVLDKWETDRIKQMYAEGYHNPECADFVVDNSKQTPQETLDEILRLLDL